jgi:PAS domain S-box-containing protein
LDLRLEYPRPTNAEPAREKNRFFIAMEMTVQDSILKTPVPSRRHQTAGFPPEMFSPLIDGIGAVCRLVDATDGRILHISPGYEEIWDRSCESLYESPRVWFEAIHPADHGRVLEAALNAARKGGYDEEYRILRPDGSIRHVRDRVIPLRDESGRVHQLAGFAEDITTRKLLEKEIIEENDRERSRLGMDLHDGICQQLVSVAFAADLLRRDLVAKSTGEAFRVAKITASLDNAISQARGLSQALCPVNLAGAGLAVALRGLADGVSQTMGIPCAAECSELVFVEDSAVATHIYRIAQEAVKNAALACPSQIIIELSSKASGVILEISDNRLLCDGREEDRFDLGLNVIRFRAQLAGGKMTSECHPGRGRQLKCVFPIAAEPGRNSLALDTEVGI